MSSEVLSDKELEAIQTPEQWADAFLKYGSVMVITFFDDTKELSLDSSKLQNKSVIGKTHEGFQTHVFHNATGIAQEAFIKLNWGWNSGRIYQQVYTDMPPVDGKKENDHTANILCFTTNLELDDKQSKLPARHMVLQYRQELSIRAIPQYEERRNVELNTDFLIPDKFGVKFIKEVLKNPILIEKVLQLVLPGLTANRRRRKVKKLVLIESAGIKEALTGRKVLKGVSQTVQFPEQVGEEDI